MIPQLPNPDPIKNFMDKSAYLEYLLANAETNQDVLNRVKRNLLIAIEYELSEPERQAIILKFYDGLSQKEIAKKLGVNPATISRNLTRAKNKLRYILSYSF